MRFRVNMMTVGVSQGLGFSKFMGPVLSSCGPLRKIWQDIEFQK